jgi:hypothetical protein
VEAKGLLVTGDLFFSSKVTGTANALGEKVDVAGSTGEAAARISERDYRFLFVDLETPGLDLEGLLATLPAGGRPKVVAFGPHVQTARLESARAAGCDVVLPRSRFSADLPWLLEVYLAD